MDRGGRIDVWPKSLRERAQQTFASGRSEHHRVQKSGCAG